MLSVHLNEFGQLQSSVKSSRWEHCITHHPWKNPPACVDQLPFLILSDPCLTMFFIRCRTFSECCWQTWAQSTSCFHPYQLHQWQHRSFGNAQLSPAPSHHTVVTSSASGLHPLLHCDGHLGIILKVSFFYFKFSQSQIYNNLSSWPFIQAVPTLLCVLTIWSQV